MATAGIKVIDKVKVREVAGIFHSRDALAPAVDALLLAGFDRADIDVIIGGPLAREKLGGVHVSIDELPEVPGVPRQPFIVREDLVEVLALAFAILIFIGAALAGWIVVATSGSLAWAAVAVAAAIGAVAAAGIGGLIARAFARKHARELLAQSAAREFVLCVRVRSLEQEAKAQEILTGNGAEAVRSHEIQIEKHLKDLPLHSLRVDPWLGEEALGRP
jgi:hypothetical protein